MKAFLFVALFAVASATASVDYEREFGDFMARFGRVYSDKYEQDKRMAIFTENLRNIHRHNANPAAKWSEGINQFADLTHEEFVSTLNGFVDLRFGSDASLGLPSADGHSADRMAALDDLPDSVHWGDNGVLTAVKDQGSCGSCWAMAGTVLVESYVALNNGTLLELSLQQMTSCTPNSLNCGGTGGCQGSIPQLAFTYTELYGLTSEEEYPYVSGRTGDTGSCNFDPDTTPARAMIRGMETLPRNDYVAVMEHVANVGPLAVSVAASPWSFYSGGVFDGCDYDSNVQLNHVVQLVGYGTTDEGEDYWLVRNSWSETWGEGGFMKLKRESSPRCGIDTTPLYGTACENDGQHTQYVCGACAILFDASYPIGAQLV